MRILGIDYGDTRIGLALSDPTATIAGGLPLYLSKTMRKDIDHIATLVQQHQVEKIVLGLPKNMDGSLGERANKTQSFGKVLEKITGVPVIYKDERLTTVMAHRALDALGTSRNKQKATVDTTSAQIILQSYLDGVNR